MKKLTCIFIIGLMLAETVGLHLKSSFGDSSPSILWQKDLSGIVKIGNVTGETSPDVVVNSGGGVCVFDGQGNPIWDFTLPKGGSSFEVGDIDNDSLDDVLVIAETGWCRGPAGFVSANATLYAIKSSGVLLWERFLSSYYSGGGQQVISIGDVNDDEMKEIAVDAFQKVMLFNSSGNTIWSHDLIGAQVGNIRISDVDGNGIAEVVVTYWRSISAGGIIALDGAGNVLWDFPTQAGMKALTIADIDEDSGNEIVASTYETLGSQQGVYLLNGSGSLLWHKPYANDTNSFAIGDVDDDGVNDIVSGTDLGDVYAIDGNSSILWDAHFDNSPISGVAVGDFGGSGKKDQVAACGSYFSLNPSRQDGTWVFDRYGHLIWNFTGQINFISMFSGDLNSDGVDDIVVSAEDLENQFPVKIYALTSSVRVPSSVRVTVDFSPRTMNLNIGGDWIIACVTLPEGILSNEINVSSVMLNETIYADTVVLNGSDDMSNHGNANLTLKFAREQISLFLLSENITCGEVALTLAGRLFDGTSFEGTGKIRIGSFGDVNFDGRTDMQDVMLVVQGFNSFPGGNRWNPDADLDGNGRVDLRDIGIVLVHFGGG